MAESAIVDILAALRAAETFIKASIDAAERLSQGAAHDARQTLKQVQDAIAKAEGTSS